MTKTKLETTESRMLSASNARQTSEGVSRAHIGKEDRVPEVCRRVGGEEAGLGVANQQMFCALRYIVITSSLQFKKFRAESRPQCSNITVDRICLQ
jgi:hypothetical protein